MPVPLHRRRRHAGRPLGAGFDRRSSARHRLRASFRAANPEFLRGSRLSSAKDRDSIRENRASAVEARVSTAETEILRRKPGFGPEKPGFGPENGPFGLRNGGFSAG